MKIGETISGALFSSDHKHRYSLWRIWNRTKPALLFIGLNPSTANDVKDDPTIVRLVGFAKSWGFGGLFAGNLYSIVSSDPKVLINPISPFVTATNDIAIRQMMNKTTITLVGWGEWGKELGNRPAEVLALLDELFYCLKVNKSGEPCHPLYLPRDSKLIEYHRTVKACV